MVSYRRRPFLSAMKPTPHASRSSTRGIGPGSGKPKEQIVGPSAMRGVKSGRATGATRGPFRSARGADGPRNAAETPNHSVSSITANASQSRLPPQDVCRERKGDDHDERGHFRCGWCRRCGIDTGTVEKDDAIDTTGWRQGSTIPPKTLSKEYFTYYIILGILPSSISEVAVRNGENAARERGIL